MKKLNINKLYLWIIFIVCILYFVLSYITFMRSEVVKINETTHIWRSLSELLAFPMVPLLNSFGISGSEIAAIMIVNGLFWGSVVAFFAYLISRVRN